MAKTDLKLYDTDKPLAHADVDANFRRLGYWSGDWAAGSYQANEMVWFEGGIYRCLIDTTATPLNSGDWEPITPRPGIGAMVAAVPIAGPDLGAGFQVINQFDTISIPTFGCTLNTITGEFRTLARGVWDIELNFSIEHDELNQSRDTRVRLWNVTTGAAVGHPFVIGIGRNTNATDVYIKERIIAGSTVHDFRVEIGGGDAVALVTWQSNGLYLLQIAL